MGVVVLIFGIVVLLTPAVRMAMDGVEDEDGVDRWMANQSLDNLLLIKAMVVSGLVAILLGVILIASGL